MPAYYGAFSAGITHRDRENRVFPPIRRLVLCWRAHRFNQEIRLKVKWNSDFFFEKSVRKLKITSRVTSARNGTAEISLPFALIFQFQSLRFVTFHHRWNWIFAKNGHNSRIQSKRPPCCFNNQFPTYIACFMNIVYDTSKCTLQTLHPFLFQYNHYDLREMSTQWKVN